MITIWDAVGIGIRTYLSNGLALLLVGPPLWFFNCCSGTEPEWDIDNSTGVGILPGFSGVFGFTTAPRADVIVPGVAPGLTSWMHSWVNDLQVNLFTGDISVPGQQIPEPGALLLIGAGLVAFIGYSRRKDNC